MIGDFEGFAAALRNGGAGDDVFIHFQIGLKIESVSGMPFLQASDGGEVFLAEDRGIPAIERLEIEGRITSFSLGGDFQDFCGNGEERFAMEKREKVPVKCGVNLQAVSAMLFDVGIDEAGYDAIASERFGQLLSQSGGEICR